MQNLNSEPSSDDLFKLVSKSLATSVTMARNVSSEDDNGDPSKQTLDELAQISGVGRSTIAKYASSTRDTGSASVVNPDLRTICRLAHSLNVPPALLLMRHDDWARLAQAVIDYVREIDDERVQSITDQVVDATRTSYIEKAKLAVKLAERCGKYKPDDELRELLKREQDSPIAEEIKFRSKRTKQGIMATSALPPLMHLPRQAVAAVLTLCVKLGATYQ